METVLERYRERFPGSGVLYEKGRRIIGGGGHQSRVVNPFPVYVERAEGALKWDVDGNEIVDYMMGYGALILGHGNPKVVEAITRQLDDGTNMGTANPLELRWAELVRQLIPSAEQVRFAASGTEATLLAIRLSRAKTGKSKIIKFREHFHGWHDYVAMDSGLNTSNGIPEETLSTVIVLEPDVSRVEEVLSQNDDVAAVILEPTGAHFGQFPLSNPAFLQDIRDLTTKHGVIMIMDEVITGFRVSRGGAQGRFQVLPDLTTMAKVVAGGLPGGAVCGKAEIMEQLVSDDDSVRIAHPGTYNGNPLSASAGIAALEQIAGDPVNETADAMADRLKNGMREALARAEVPGHVHGIASIVQVALGVECGCGGGICTLPHSELARATGGDDDHAGLAQPLKLAMLAEGVDTMGGVGMLVSAAHREEDIDRTADSFERALRLLRADGMI